MSTNLPSGTVTFLFTDIEGSTKLAREHPKTWEAARARHHAIVRNAIESNNGFVFQIIGDAFCAAFHTAGDALGAAAKSQMDLHTENWVAAPIKVRMGIHTGKAEIQENGEYHGYLAMSRIQRLMSAGHGGQVLISAATQELLLEELPEDISMRDLGERRLKDLIRPEHIYQLVSANLPTDFPPLKTLDAYRHNLPVQLTSFIGREKEMEEIKQSLTTHRLTTLTGSGGTGKTRLSLQVAADMLDQFPDGIWFVELVPLTDPDLIPQTILSTLGVPEQAGMTALQLLLDFLQGENILLVLDNCEHLIQACAELVGTLLSSTSALNVIATSREALGVPGEMIWQVPSLSLPDVKQLPAIEQFSQYEAVQLFIERATLVQPHFVVTNDNTPAIAQICFRLDGIPLAIELAAARVRALSIEQISRRLDDRFRLLTGGSRTALERHQTLRAAIDWSYNLLSGDEKLLLCRLSIFVGGWTLEAAEQVCAGKNDMSSYDVLDLLTHLVDKSLVILDESRYRMLETTRQYVREKLFESEESETLRDQHLAYFLDFAEQADKEIHGPDQAEWMDRVEKEHDNYRAAFEWCLSTKKTELALNLLGALGWAWFVRGYHGDASSWFDKIRAMPDVADYPIAYGRTLNLLGMVGYSRGDYSSARIFLEQAVSIFQALGVAGESGMAIALDQLGMVVSDFEGDHKGAQNLTEKAAELYAKCGNRSGYARALFHLGYDNQDTTLALSLFERSLAIYSELGDVQGMGRVYHGLSWLFSYQQNFAKARPMAEQALANDQRIGFKAGIVGDLIDLGMVCLAQGDDDAAIGFYQASLEISHQSGLKMDRAIALHYLGLLALHRKDYGHATKYLTDSLACYPSQCHDLNVAQRLAGLAAVDGATYQPERAAKLSGAAQSITDTTDYRIPPFDRAEFDQHIQIALEQLGKAAFESLQAEGRTMTIEQAIAFALEKSDD